MRTTDRRSNDIDYQAIVAASGASSLTALIAYLFEELPFAWRDAYLPMSSLPPNIMRFQSGSFEYIFDHCEVLDALGTVDPSAESRLVAVHGLSVPKKSGRDDYRLRGWVGPTNGAFGRKWDKGHFIGHSIGGAVDRAEVNVFIQRRDLNRGWSSDGKRFRLMERFCAQHAGTFCFSRPIYADETAKPAALEFGVLRGIGDLWIDRFDNT